MLHSYIGRLLLIYAIALILIMAAVYTFYDDWLEPQVSQLESLVVPECETCTYIELFQEEGLQSLATLLDLRMVKTGHSYAILNNKVVTAGDLQWFHKNREKIRQKIVTLNGKASNEKKGVMVTLWRDVNAGIAISSIRLDKNNTLYIQEYLRVKSEFVLSADNQQIVGDNIRGITSQIALSGLFLLFLGFIATSVIVGKIYHKLKNINQTADHIIKHQDLSQRILHSGGNNEFDQLARNLNNMLSKIEAKVEDIRHISNSIAHDLRTPLTSLHNKLEQLELDEPIALNLTTQVDNIITTFDSLLRISHLESGNAYIVKQQVDLIPVVEDVIDLFRPLAEEKEQTLIMALGVTSVKVDVNLLFQALGNLLENAIKYAPENSGIIISSIQQNENVVISVQDEGDGIPSNKLEDVIQRFVRLDETRNSPGNGLGLSMVNAISAAHQGSFELNNLSKGFKASIRIPL